MTRPPAHALGYAPTDIYPADLYDQYNWSQATFGPGPRVGGVIDHITKELDEVRASPDDASEWADIIILAIDGAMRQGITAEALILAYHRKMARNKTREWPDWRTLSDNVAIEHIRSTT